MFNQSIADKKFEYRILIVCPRRTNNGMGRLKVRNPGVWPQLAV